MNNDVTNQEFDSLSVARFKIKKPPQLVWRSWAIRPFAMKKWKTLL
jgi:hypothetical protein